MHGTRARLTRRPAAGSAEQIAEYLGIGRTGIFGLIKQGRLPAVKIGRRTLIRYADADALLADAGRDIFA